MEPVASSWEQQVGLAGPVVTVAVGVGAGDLALAAQAAPEEKAETVACSCSPTKPMGPDRRSTDPAVPLSIFESYRMATDEKIATIKTKVDTFDGALKFIKWTIGLIFGAVGTDVLGHAMGWFKHG